MRRSGFLAAAFVALLAVVLLGACAPASELGGIGAQQGAPPPAPRPPTGGIQQTVEAAVQATVSIQQAVEAAVKATVSSQQAAGGPLKPTVAQQEPLKIELKPVVTAPVQESGGQPPAGGAIASAADVPRMSAEQAKAKVDAGEAVIFDARRKTSYDRQHIAGSLSLPVNEVGTRLNELPLDKQAVFY